MRFASSAQSERDFSSVGRTVTDMRSRLNENTVEALKVLRWGLSAELISNYSCCSVVSTNGWNNVISRIKQDVW